MSPPPTVGRRPARAADSGVKLRRAAGLSASGVAMVALLALSDDGAPVYDHGNASSLAALGIPAFACTPEKFPELLAAAIEQRDLGEWATANLARQRRGRDGSGTMHLLMNNCYAGHAVRSSRLLAKLLTERAG